MYRILVFLTVIILLASCHDFSKESKTSIDIAKNKDSIFIQFEEIAYEESVRYINNPDSFLQSYIFLPETRFQHELYCSGLIAMGYNLLEKGEIFESIKLYEQAYNISMKENITIDEDETPLIKPLANLYIRINDTEKAIHLLENFLKNDNNNDTKAAILNNLAIAYLYNNKLDSAKRKIELALTKSNTPLQQALLNNTLSTIFLRSKDTLQSKKYNDISLQLFKNKDLKSDTLLWFISALGNHGEINNNAISIQNAIELLNENFLNNQIRTKAKLQLALAELYIKSNRIVEALAIYNKIIHQFTREQKHHVLDYTFTKALVQKASIFSKNKQIDSVMYYYEWAIENDFKTQQLIVNDESQLDGNVWNRNHVNNLIQLVQQKSTQDVDIQTLLWCIELSKARLLINDINRNDNWNDQSNDRRQAFNQIRMLYQKYDESTDRNAKYKINQQIEDLTKTFQLSEQHFQAIRFEPNKKAFLKRIETSGKDYYSYLSIDNNQMIVVGYINQQWVYRLIDDVDFKNSLKRFKNDYFKDSPNAYNNNPKIYQDRANSLLKKLLPHIQSANENIFISPDAELYGLPFDALYDEDFLIKNHNFGYINSFLLFDILKNNIKIPSSSITVLYRANYDKPLPNLPYVFKEIENLNSSFKTADIPPNRQNDKVLNNEFGKNNIIHIAAHTLLDSSHAPIIYLKNKISTNQLRYYDINTPLVFLSACNTGQGKSLPAEGTESIQRVFLSKNVPSVISTYWFANDATMLKLTANFYKELHNSKQPISALANAKRNFLDEAGILQQNPWYWANINYAGVGNELDVNSKLDLAHYVWIVVGIFIIILMYYILSNTNVTLINKHKKTK